MHVYFFVIIGVITLFTLLNLAMAYQLARNHPEREQQLFEAIIEQMRRNTIRTPDLLRLLTSFRRQGQDAKIEPDLPKLPSPPTDQQSKPV